MEGMIECDHRAADPYKNQNGAGWKCLTCGTKWYKATNKETRVTSGPQRYYRPKAAAAVPPQVVPTSPPVKATPPMDFHTSVFTQDILSPRTLERLNARDPQDRLTPRTLERLEALNSFQEEEAELFQTPNSTRRDWSQSALPEPKSAPRADGPK